MRKIQLVPLSRREEMRKYFYDYLTELSEFDLNITFDEKGKPIYNWYDCYWVDKSRFPFYLVIDNEVAGLALIRELKDRKYEIAEFYVCPNYRKDGNSIWFATELVKLFDGEFCFSTMLTNVRAVKFWNKFTKLFSDGTFYDDTSYRNWTIRKISVGEHTLNLAPIYFDFIKSGEKTLEGRLNDEKRQKFNVGDYITFFKEPEKTETMQAIILDKYIFKDFEEMAKILNKKDLGFNLKTVEEMINTYRTIYKRDDENKYGVVIFKIKVI